MNFINIFIPESIAWFQFRIIFYGMQACQDIMKYNYVIMFHKDTQYFRQTVLITRVYSCELDQDILVKPHYMLYFISNCLL